ncbi:SMI1/KNR4 family protein [Arthrobacter sp. HMWF013]|uniref:SMI1/KNR4 family protein n=1 Tax=Arthrobacter sp. HMWF013 TaxID=2056849 RepID=UPI0011B1FD10|nr:SMI1/KNR4 family protein [Arthrobacter sp. HMWF013]
MIRSLQGEAPNGWPGELSTLYRLADGAERSTAGYIYPRYRPLPLEEVGRTRQMLLGIEAQVGEAANAAFEREQNSPLYRNLRMLHQAGSGVPLPEPQKPYDPAKAEADDAGTRASFFISPFLPIAEDGSGDFLFVDLRGGRQHGCVGEYFKGDADWRPAIWPSVEALLEDILSSLESGRPVFSSRPSVVNGSLTWEYAQP